MTNKISTLLKANWPRGYKTFFMLNSVENEILNAHKYKKYQEIRLFQAEISLKCYFPPPPLINIKMPTIVGILTFMSRNNFMLSLIEHENSFITSGPD